VDTTTYSINLGWQSWSDTRKLDGKYPKRYFSPFKDQLVEQDLKVSSKTSKTAPTGWCSWPNFGTNISEEIILKQATEAKKFGLEYILIDDGWTTWGDWLKTSKSKFPNGLKSLVSKINKLNLKVGIWWAPMLAKQSSKLFHEHPDWFLKNLEGTQVSPLDVLIKDKRMVLDLEQDEVQNYLNEVLSSFQNMGIELIKSDFLYANHFNHKYSSLDIPDHILESLLYKIRNTGVYSIACGCPISPALGIVDAIRVSDDLNFPILNGIWPLNTIIPNLRIKQLIANLKTRKILKKYTTLDCDTYFTSSKMGISSANCKILAKAVKDNTDLKFIGDDMTSLSQSQKVQIAKFLEK
jgi:alpha-galactosidase